MWEQPPISIQITFTAFVIKPTEVSFNVDINANQKHIRSIALDRDSNNSAATVAMVKELQSGTKVVDTLV